MNEGLILTFLLLAWLVIALVAHAVLSRYFVAAFLSALLMTGVTQLASYMEVGHLDPLWVVSSVAAFGMALIVSLLVGIPFRLVRKLQKERGGDGL